MQTPGLLRCAMPFPSLSQSWLSRLQVFYQVFGRHRLFCWLLFERLMVCRGRVMGAQPDRKTGVFSPISVPTFAFKNVLDLLREMPLQGLSICRRQRFPSAFSRCRFEEKWRRSECALCQIQTMARVLSFFMPYCSFRSISFLPPIAQSRSNVRVK